MNEFAALDLQPGRFAVGQPVPRKEDPVLLRGEGRYTDDLNLPGQLHAVMVRSRVAHGVLRRIDAEAARRMPGVHGVYVAADLKAAGIQPMQVNVTGQNHDGSPLPRPAQWALAEGKVRYVGDPIAVVVADTVQCAKDAAEAVIADIDPLPAVTTAREAAARGAPTVHAEAPNNVVLDWKFGDAAAADAAFARAAHITKLNLPSNRIIVSAMEPRAAIAEYDAGDERFVLRIGCQGVFGARRVVSGVLGVPVEKVRVLTGNVGGSFGMKAGCYPEYISILYAARTLGRPLSGPTTAAKVFSPTATAAITTTPWNWRSMRGETFSRCA
jgi:aerobic carbon-monoxide dehydrogenase large subunit